ncbi:hypothetical protein CGCA056_v003850 [Colletotrichum aenigma]|uniref:uncharacterized protein n=1 Tax=Colletotrichum aenigma TaxID=1215731 RepID=UPI001872E556|nr:uncharacterized protein CGCA056_v003850 [Colletotrichum aenigma]KAF5525969.1 hypothetical protein CGCA056_v003850 [Colletotrichum aenigma]
MGIFNVLLCASAVSAYTVTNVGRFMLKNIYPVVIPGQYASHMHTFFGSDAVTANTTTSKELQAGCSTAENPNDYSSYWVPTLFYKNSTGTFPAPIFRFSAYYVSIDKAEVAIPQNYKAVVGNSSATSQDGVENLAGIQWFCDHGGQGTTDGKDAAEFPSKTCPAHLQTILLFHECVNETTLESTYSGVQHWTKTFRPENRCPLGMKRMPQLRFSIRYDLRTALPDGWDGPAPLELACGSSYCTHGDFINGWLPEAAENMLKANDKRDFAGVDGPNGKYNAGTLCKTTAVDADPEHGTSDYAKSKEILASLKG